jgi:hypothetical protein
VNAALANAGLTSLIQTISAIVDMTHMPTP